MNRSATSPVTGSRQAASSRRVAIAVAVLALIAVPYAIQQVYYVNIASQILLYAVFALGLNVLVGYAGLVSLGHAGLFGVAAYVVAYLLAAGYGHARRDPGRRLRRASSPPRALPRWRCGRPASASS